MTIIVRYFASLRETMGRAEQRVEAQTSGTVADVWSAASGGKPMPDNVLAAVNQEYVSTAHAVSDGDEVAFFPPVTGG